MSKKYFRNISHDFRESTPRHYRFCHHKHNAQCRTITSILNWIKSTCNFQAQIHIDSGILCIHNTSMAIGKQKESLSSPSPNQNLGGFLPVEWTQCSQPKTSIRESRTVPAKARSRFYCQLIALSMEKLMNTTYSPEQRIPAQFCFLQNYQSSEKSNVYAGVPRDQSYFSQQIFFFR